MNSRLLSGTVDTLLLEVVSGGATYGYEIAQTVLATDGPVDSTTLMKGRRELIIRHGADTYRLRITASNKLILTK